MKGEGRIWKTQKGSRGPGERTRGPFEGSGGPGRGGVWRAEEMLGGPEEKSEMPGEWFEGPREPFRDSGRGLRAMRGVCRMQVGVRRDRITYKVV